MILSFVSFFGILGTVNDENYLYNEDSSPTFDIKTASNGQAIRYSLISQNVSNVYRVFESIKFEINTSDFTDVDQAIMQIHFYNNSLKNYTMVEGGVPGNYTYTYNPEYNAPLGEQIVSFFLLNQSLIQLNAHTTFVNFTILSNYTTFLNSSEYYRGDIVYGEFKSDLESFNFDWNITVVDDVNEIIQSNLFNLGNNVGYFSFEINESFLEYEKTYYIKINMSRSSPTFIIGATYIHFKVSSTAPHIVISSVDFSPQEIKRIEDCTVSLNISDDDLETFPENITVSMNLKQPNGQLISPIILTNNDDWSFTTTFSIDIDKEIGVYEVTFEAEDQYGIIGSYTTTIRIKNNPPEIHGFEINGLTINQRISINYGDDMIFTFNVSDVEDTIAYITVGLLNENNEWYNITQAYQDGMELKIRSVELISGIWYVYLTVTDIDGGTTNISSDFGIGPREIRIVPDLLTPIFPWITLIIGLVFGIIFGIGIVYNRYKSKISETQIKLLKKKESPPSQKPKKKKSTPTKQRSEEEEFDDTVSEKEDLVKTKPQRKIKRKLQ